MLAVVLSLLLLDTGVRAGLNISEVPGSQDLSITVDGEEWFRFSKLIILRRN